MKIEDFMTNDDVIKKVVSGYEFNIAPQLNDSVVDDLSQIFADLRNNKNKNKIQKKLLKDMSNLILDRFGLKTTIVNGLFGTYPDMSREDVLLPDLINMGNKPHIKNKNKLENYDLEVDYKKAKIYGIEKLNHILQIDLSVVEDTKYSIRELVAITMHEIGHLFTFLETSTRIVKNTTNLLEAMQDIAIGNVDSAKKITNNEFEIKIDDETSAKTLIANFKRDVEVIKNLGENRKDSEIMADNFSSRFGLSSELATGLDKILGSGKSASGSLVKEYTTNFLIIVAGFFISNFSLLALITALSGLEAGIAFITALIFLNLNYFLITSLVFLFFGAGMKKILNPFFTYDAFIERIEKLKRNDIAMIRKYRLPKASKESLLKSIDRLDIMLVTFKSKGIDNYIQNLISSNPDLGKETNPTELRNIILNKLQNNDLHYLVEKAVAGNESLNDLIGRDKIVIEKQYLNTSTLVKNIPINEKPFLKKLNTVLKPFEAYIEISKDGKEVIFFSKSRLFVNYGISSVGLVFENKKDIIYITKDMLKIRWFKSIFPTYKALDNYTDNKDKRITYIVTVPKVLILTTVKDNEELTKKYSKQIKEIDKFHKVGNEVEKDYGDYAYINNIHLLINACEDNNIDDDIIEQLRKIDDIYNKNINGVNMNGWLDLHNGNIGIDDKGKIVFIDPVYTNTINGKKIKIVD